MLLLKAHSLTSTRKIIPEAMGLQLNERGSTATLTLGPDAPALNVGAWLMDETDPGAGIVWRVRSLKPAYGQQTTTVQLEHAVTMLKDLIIFGEKKPEDINGKKGAKSCTAKEAVQFVLKQQSDWALGSFDYNVSNPYKFDGDTLFDALETVSNSLTDCWWSYDFSSYPFRINFTKKSSSIGSVLRVGRNLTAISKTIDKSGMFTRFYPIGKDDLHISGGGYVEKNTSAYGVVSKVETDQTITTEAELKRWANERLNIHSTPIVTIDVEGMELSAQSGETLDKLRLGRQCYVPLAEFGTEILETISELNYQDKIKQPDVFRAVLANSRNDVTKIIANEIKRGGGGGRASARQQKEDHAWFEDTSEHVAMCAKGIIGVDAQGNPNWTQMSQIWVDGNGISQKVTAAQHGVDYCTAQIGVQAEQIELKVDKGGVIQAIRVSTEGVQIQASKVDLGDYATVVQLNGVKGDFDELTSGQTTAGTLKTHLLSADTGFTYQSHAVSFKTVTIDGTTYHLMGYT